MFSFMRTAGWHFLTCKFRRVIAAAALWAATLAQATAQDKAPASDLPPELAAIPRDSFAFVHLRPADILQSEPAARIRKLFPQQTERVLKFLGDDLEQTESMTMVFPTPKSLEAAVLRLLPADKTSSDNRSQAKLDHDPKALSGTLQIVTALKPFDRSVLERVLGAGSVEKTHVHRTYYAAKDNRAFLPASVHFVNDRTYVLAFTEEKMRQTLEGTNRSAGAGPLDAALELARRKRHVVVGCNAAAPESTKELRALWQAYFGRWRSSLASIDVCPMLAMRSAALAVDVGTDVRFEGEFTFPDAQSAAKASAALEDTFALVRLLYLRRIHLGTNSEMVDTNPTYSEYGHRMASVRSMLRIDSGELRNTEALIFADLLLGQLKASLRKPAIEQHQARLKIRGQTQVDVDALDESARRQAREILNEDAVFIHVQVAEIWQSEAVKHLIKSSPVLEEQLTKATELVESLDNVASLSFILPTKTFVWPRETNQIPMIYSDFMLVVRTKQPIDRTKLLMNFKVEKKHNHKTYFKCEEWCLFQAVHLVDDRTLLLTTREQGMMLALNRTPLFQAGPSLVAALEAAKAKHPLVVCVNLKESTMAAGLKEFMNTNPAAGHLTPLLDARSVVLGIGLDKKDNLRIEADVAFGTAAQAAAGVAGLEDALDLLRLRCVADQRAALRPFVDAVLRDDDGPLLFGDHILLPAERPVLEPKRDLRPLFLADALFAQANSLLRKAGIERHGSDVKLQIRTRLEFERLGTEALQSAKAYVKSQETELDVFKSERNLRAILGAIRSYQEVHGKFPVSGKLSWRVQILPYLDELALYNEFRHDEPWDSVHNKKLLPRMPKIFAAPGRKYEEPFITRYQMMTGPGTVFDAKYKGKGVDEKNREIDGLALAEAEGTAWTSPVDLVYDAKKPLPKLGGVFPHGLHLAYLNGHVFFAAGAVDEADMRGHIFFVRERNSLSSSPLFLPAPPR